MSQVPGGSAEDQIKALTKQYTDALVKGDTATLDRLMADDYISQSAASGTLNKQQYIDNIRNGDTKWDTADVSNQDVRLYGDDVAVSTATVNLKGHSKAKGDINGTYQVMRVWVKRNGQWQTVSFQSTPMSGNQSATQR